MEVRLYPGAFRRPNECPTNNPLIKTIYNSINVRAVKPKAMAFDLDETLGSFSDLYSIWDTLTPMMKTRAVFNALLDLYPEFLRVGILSILEFLKSKIKSGQCLPIFIYTNNQCEDQSWVERLLGYLEMRLGTAQDRIPSLTPFSCQSGNTQIFARPILAFKIRNRCVEPNRTTHEKTYREFVRCSMLKHTDLCFVDDQTHEKMKHRRVYYIQPPPYVHRLTRKEVIDRFVDSKLCRTLYPDGAKIPQQFPAEDLERSPLSFPLKKEQEITNKMMYYIREFFFVSSKRCYTKKCRRSISGFTRRKR